MKLENSFEVPASPEEAWALLMDVPRIIPCMPGATLDEAVDDENWKATMAVKLGLISLSFKADVKRQESDEAAQRASSDCLKKKLGAATPEEAAAAVAEQARPVGGLRLGLGALWRSFTRLFRRG